METNVSTIDRAGWGSGPWDNEPDRLEWRAYGLPCLVLRSETTGALCGYVAVPKGHVCHGMDGDEIPVGCHGGVTYSAACDARICHVPEPGEPDDVWWIGFDCSHAGDCMPRWHICGEYRDLAYVRAAVEQLAEQLSGLGA